MPKKALASLNVVINAVTSPLFRGLKIASKRLVAFGTKMKAIGRSISMSFTLPFAMVGVAGAKMAIEFEQSMTKINTLVGTSAKEVNKLGESVLKMAVETATPAKELADALFFIQSAGITGAASMDTLRVSAKGAAMNMGDITDIASATTSIMTAFGKTSDDAGDLLHETLKQGKFDAGEFMSKIGQVIPTAAGLGVSFEELGAATATMSKLSGDAAGSLTAINSVMMSLGTPGAEQKQILKDLNMSYDDLNSMMKDSLMGTLNHLFTSLEGNDEALVRVFGSSKAVKGAFATAGLQAETYAGVLDGMNNSMGNVEKGFQTQSKTVGFKMAQSLEKLQQAGMELGSTLMPVFTTIADGAVKIARAFTSLDGGTKKLVVGAAALLAFSGPLMTLAGGIVSAIGMILSPIGLVVTALGALFYVIYDNWGATKTIFVNFINYWIDLYNESIAFKVLVEGIGVVFLSLWSTVKFFFVQSYTILKNFGKQFLDIFGGIGDMIEGVFKGSWKQVEAGADKMGEALDRVFKNDESKKNVENYVEEIKGHLDNAAKNIKTKTKIQLVTEDDIQGGVDDISNWLTEKLTVVKNKMKGFLGGSVLAVPEGGGDPAPASGGGGTKELEKTLAKQKTLMESYLEWAKEGYEGFAGKVGEVWGEISKHAGAALNGIGNLMSAQHEKAMTEITNQETAEQGSLDKEFERNALRIENSKMSQEQKDAALNQLKAKFDGKQADLDKKFDDKKKALALKQAKRDKAMKIASAIMGTAQAIVQALTAGPIAGPILAGLMAGLGAAQIATIASTPLPMADGGIAFGPTNALVGEYPGAKNDPEVVAPLSKLKGMLGNSMAQNVQLNVGGVLKGEDIFLANDNTDNQRERYI
jgi:TP901 family phage tail tape measure protein